MNARRLVDTGILTVQQRRVLDAVAGYWVEHGIAPTVRDVASAVGCVPSTISHHIAELEAAGRVERRPRIPRSLRVVDLAQVPS